MPLHLPAALCWKLCATAALGVAALVTMNIGHGGRSTERYGTVVSCGLGAAKVLCSAQ